jgi:hypothetical protein
MDIVSIQKRIDSIEKLKEDMKTSQEAIKNALENDGMYQDVTKQAKEINTKKKRIKDDVLNQAENREFVEKVKDTKEEIATLEELLAYELMEYSQSNNTDMIQGADGLVRKFKILVRLLPGRGFDSEQGNSYLGENN